MKYDLAIIGGGSAGLSVAAAAAQFGEKVVLIEKGEMGGDCLNFGCIPSKALLAAAKHLPPDCNKAMKHVAEVIAAIAPHDSQERFEGLGVRVIREPARFVAPDQLQAGAEIFTARRFVIATGSRAGVPPIAGLADVPFFTNKNFFKNRERPKHLIIIGAGPVGLEMAQAHCRLGSKVTVLDASVPLANDDPELVTVVLEKLAAEGIAIKSKVNIARINKDGASVKIELEDGTVIEGSHLLVAAGRKANVEGLGLEAGQIAFDDKGITVNEGLRSISNHRVYAAGDVAGGLQFTHVAGYHAGLIIRNALFRLPIHNRTEHIPRVTYTDPELAHVGLSEAEAREKFGAGIRVLRASFSTNDRARTDSKTDGFVKVIVSARGKILGADIVGAQAGELIAPLTLCVAEGLRISSLANLVLPYPTLSEAIKRAAISYYADMPKKPLVRRVIGILKLLG